MDEYLLKGQIVAGVACEAVVTAQLRKSGTFPVFKCKKVPFFVFFHFPVVRSFLNGGCSGKSRLKLDGSGKFALTSTYLASRTNLSGGLNLRDTRDN